MKIKVDYLKKVNKIDKTLVKLTNLIKQIRNLKGYVTIDTKEIQRVIG